MALELKFPKDKDEHREFGLAFSCGPLSYHETLSKPLFPSLSLSVSVCKMGWHPLCILVSVCSFVGGDRGDLGQVEQRMKEWQGLCE